MYQLCAMNGHYRFYELDVFFDEIQKAGFVNAELWTSPHHYFVDYQQYDDPVKLRHLAESHQVKIRCICPEQTNPKPNNVAVKGKAAKERVYAYYRNIVDAAKEAGADKVLITPGWAYYSEAVEEARKRSVEMLSRVSEYAAQKQILLVMEALQPNESRIANTAADLKALKQMVGNDNLKICLDLGAMARMGESIDDYFEVFKKDVAHCHFVDGAPVGHLAWGDGERSMKDDLEAFGRNGYEGLLSLESVNDRYYEKPYLADQKTMELFMKNQGEKGI